MHKLCYLFSLIILHSGAVAEQPAAPNAPVVPAGQNSAVPPKDVKVPDPAKQEVLFPGLVAEYFQFRDALSGLPDISKKKPVILRVEKSIEHANVDGAWEGTDLWNNFSTRWSGVIRIPKTAKYYFFTFSEDGSALFIDDKMVVDNGGLHGMNEGGGKAELMAGDHLFRVEFFNNGGDPGCIARWKPEGEEETVIPPEVFFHPPNSGLCCEGSKITPKDPAPAKQESKPDTPAANPEAPVKPPEPQAVPVPDKL